MNSRIEKAFSLKGRSPKKDPKTFVRDLLNEVKNYETSATTMIHEAEELETLDQEDEFEKILFESFTHDLVGQIGNSLENRKRLFESKKAITKVLMELNPILDAFPEDDKIPILATIDNNLMNKMRNQHASNSQLAQIKTDFEDRISVYFNNPYNAQPELMLYAGHLLII